MSCCQTKVILAILFWTVDNKHLAELFLSNINLTVEIHIVKYLNFLHCCIVIVLWISNVLLISVERVPVPFHFMYPLAKCREIHMFPLVNTRK